MIFILQNSPLKYKNKTVSQILNIYDRNAAKNF